MAMNEWWLLGSGLVLLMIALTITVWPLRRSRLMLLLLPVLGAAVIAAYWQWGSGQVWVEHVREIKRQQQVRDMMKSIHGPEDLITRLQAVLRQQPDSARGWYLLGRVYASQQQWQQADQAFSKAWKLKPDDDLITVNYARNLWELNHQQLNDNSRHLLLDVLGRNAKQPDALAMLAMDAFENHHDRQAIDYWQQLLAILDSRSDEASSIRKAIARAQGSNFTLN